MLDLKDRIAHSICTNRSHSPIALQFPNRAYSGKIPYPVIAIQISLPTGHTVGRDHAL
jgi:hypothetical protein